MLLFIYVGIFHYMQADVMPHTPLKPEGPEPNLHEGTSGLSPTWVCYVIFWGGGRKREVQLTQKQEGILGRARNF
jgi:hypothetical protein